MEQLLALGTTLNLPRLGRTRAIWLGLVAAVVLAVVAFVAVRPSEPMSLLYSGLDPAEAGKVGQRLDELKVTYEARGDGGTIMVPLSQVARIRMELAASGLPHQGGAGYELLDAQSPMNMTSFMQRVQRVRALEGELARTIATLNDVKSARVHLVLPEREGFSRETPQPTASVTVIMDGPGRLSSSQAAAVRLLIAGAVPRMRQEDVSVLDPSGVVLAADADGLAVGRLGELKQTQEAALQRTVLGLLEPLVGPGKVRVAVSEDLAAIRETQREEKFDPLSQVERSHQTQNDRDNSDENRPQNPVTVGQNLPNQQVGAGGGGTRDTTSSAHTGETTNYEISSTTSERVREPGELKRLSVAVVVDGSLDPQGNYLPRPQADLDRFGELVRSAVGFDGKRGDQLSVETLRFAPVEGLGTASDAAAAQAATVPVKLAIAGGAALLLAMAGGAVLATRRRKQQALLAAEEAEGGSLMVSAEPVEDLFSIDAVGGVQRSPLLIQLQNLVDNRPDEVMAVLQNWIVEGAAS